MSSKTKNYELHKIDLNDAPPDITVLNQNWDKLDTKLKEVNDLIEQINRELVNIGKIDLSGKADLVNGKVPENQLPEFSVDLSGKADLVEGKVPMEQLPEFSAVDGVSVTLTTNWSEQSNGAFAQTITVAGVTEDNEVVVDCKLSGTNIDGDIKIMEAWGCVNYATQATNSLTFYCYGDVPTTSIPLNVVVM